MMRKKLLPLAGALLILGAYSIRSSWLKAQTTAPTNTETEAQSNATTAAHVSPSGVSHPQVSTEKSSIASVKPVRLPASDERPLKLLDETQVQVLKVQSKTMAGVLKLSRPGTLTVFEAAPLQNGEKVHRLIFKDPQMPERELSFNLIDGKQLVVNGQLLVEWESPNRRADLEQMFKGHKDVSVFNMSTRVAAVIAPKMNLNRLEQIRNELREQKIAKLVEFHTVQLPLMSPNDPLYPQQWALENSGAGGPLADIDIDAEMAWSAGGADCRSVPVMVADSGVDDTHPDLVANLSPTLRINGMAGHPYYFPGWYYQDQRDIRDQNGHGTHVAGIIGAAGNNGIGVSGVCQQAQIVPARVGDSQGFVYDGAVSVAVDYAITNGIRVINMSFGGSSHMPMTRSAIERAAANNVLIIVAAGNDGSNNDVAPKYPANYSTQYQNVISVASLNRNNELSSFSNYGMSVDVAAPGSDILATFPTYHVLLSYYGLSPNYARLSGTSMATPYVTGAVALLLSRQPWLTPAQVKSMIGYRNELNFNSTLRTIRTSSTLNLAFLLGSAGNPNCVAIPVSWNPLINSEFVSDLYCRVLQRSADSGGLQAWTNYLNSGVDRRAIFDGFIYSQEFANRNASLPKSEAVSLAYQLMLGRKPDSGGFNHFINYPMPTVYSAILDSQEFRNRAPFYLTGAGGPGN